jgi:flagellar hook-associated protein 1 FlgK
MPGPFDGVQLMSQALRAFQRGIDTAGHNLANVNTPGYSRQRVQLGTNEALRFFQGDWRYQGQGVQMTALSRARDLMVEQRWRSQLGQDGRAATTAAGLGSLAGVYGEPGPDGVSAALDRFFNQWSAFAADPGDSAARHGVRREGQALADRVRGAWFSLDEAAATATKDALATLGQINSLAARVAELNGRIAASSADHQAPNDLLDARDSAVRELSALVDARVSTGPGGAYVVHAAGYLLVTDSGAREFPTEFDAASGTVTADGVTYTVREGVLAGTMRTISAARNQQAQLDRLANAIRKSVNDIHRTGLTFKELTNIDFFAPVSEDPGQPSGAFDFDLSALVKESADHIVAGTSGKPGDGALAQAIAGLRDVGQTSLNGRSVTEFYSEHSHAVADEARAYAQAAETAAASLEQTALQAQTVSGVNLDDEMAELVKWQRSYQAAAKAVAVYDQMAEDILAMLRR